MQSSNTPGKLLLPFAAAGGKNTIPVDSQIGIVAGKASLADGFPPLTRTPLSAGGVPPSGLDMNGILFEMSDVIRWANAGGGYAYDAHFATNANVGGYPKGARLMRSDGRGYWMNTVENNTTDPEDAGAAAAGWVPDYTSGAAFVTMTNANVTLPPLQYGKRIILLTGVLTANLNLVFPSIPGAWVVLNKCTGNFTVTCKTAAGTGFATNIGSYHLVSGDGANIYGISADLAALMFTQIGAGAVARSTLAKIQETCVSVKDFGAVGDGVADDTTPIQDAINSLSSGGVVFFPPGNYKVSSTITLLSNIKLTGEGATVSQSVSNTRIFYGTGLTNIKIDGLRFVGVGYSDTASTASAAVYGNTAFAIGVMIESSTFISIINCSFSAFLNAAIALAYNNYVFVSGNTIVGTYRGVGDTKTPPGDGSFAAFGVLVYAGNSTRVPSGYGNIRIVDNAINTTCHGVFTGPGYTNVVVSGNEISNLAQHGCYLNPGIGMNCSGNVVSLFAGNGIKVQTTSVAMFYNPSAIVIADNVVSNAPTGIWGIIVDVITGVGDVYTTLYTESVSITGNVLYNCGAGGIYAGHCRHSKIADNILNNISGIGIQVLSYDGDISNNSLYSIFTVGITATPDNYGAVEISDNVIRACTSVSGAGYITASSANVPYTYTGATNYGVNNYVQNGANVYVAVTNGTSGGGGGPTGVGSGQVDGTVTWDYVGSLAAVDDGTLYLRNNRVIYQASDLATYAFFIAGSGLSLYWKDNIFPLQKTVNIGAATHLGDDNNMHGGYVTVPAALAAIAGHHGRQFHAGQIPTSGAYQLGDIAWNIAPAPSGSIGWVCTTGGSPGTWKSFGAIAA